MSGEGIGYAISPEWIGATITLIPILVLAWWLLRGQGALWRRWVWAEVGVSVHATAQRLGGEVVPVWTGYRVVSETVRVDWRGGLRGAWTRVRVRGDGKEKRVRCEGLLDEAGVMEQVERLR